MSIRKLFSAQQRKNKLRKRHTNARRGLMKRMLNLEGLEDRRLLAAVDVIGNVLTIDDSAAESNDISLSVSAGNLLLHDANHGIAAGPGLTVVDANTVSIPASAVGSLVVNSGLGDDNLTIIETAEGLPNLSGSAPGVHSNASFERATGRTLANIGIQYDGGVGGDDAVSFELSGSSISYFADNLAASKSGVIDISGQLSLSFENLEPITIDGTGGSLTIDLTSVPASTTVTIEDDGVADDGVSMISADGGVETVLFSGFANLSVFGGDGPETITLVSLDAVDPDGAGLGTALTEMTIDGDNSLGTDTGDDVIIVQSVPVGIALTVRGGDGADTIDVSAVAGVTVEGEEGDDTIISGANHDIDGGTGNDTVDFSTTTASVIIDLDVNSAGATGTPSQDGGILNAFPGAVSVGGVVPAANILFEIDDVENAIGTPLGDGLFGNNEVNILEGEGGSDTIDGFAMDDLLSGGTGSDTILFSAAPAPVDVNLNAQVSTADFFDIVDGLLPPVFAATGGAGNNVLSGFNNVIGSTSGDEFFVSPSPTVNFSVNGNDPTTDPGDVLTVDLGGTTGAALNVLGAGAGEITFTSGENPITYSGIESLVPINGTLANAPINLGPNDNNAVLSTVGGDTVLTVDNVEVFRVPTTSIVLPIEINGEGGDDSLTLDFTGGNPVPGVGLEFNGGGQGTSFGDFLSIVGSFTNQIISYDNTPSGDGFGGNLDLDGALITFTGLEPINAGNAVNTTLNLPVGLANNATLQNSAVAGEIEIIDNGATFEDTIIPNPTGSLVVNLGDQGDLLQVNPLDAAYAASLVIHGGDGTSDNVQLNNVNLDTAGAGRGLLITETEILGITGGTISNNAANSGGGVQIDNSAGGTVATINGTTIAGNAADSGGGIFNNGGALSLLNTTISGNTASGTAANQGGGGIFNAGGTILIDSSTITLNDAASGLGGGIAGGAGGVALTNTIVAQNPGAGVEENLSGTIASNDFNLIGDADNGVLTGSTTATLFAADARLLPLTDNGSFVETHLPAVGSPAIGAGSTALNVDQRGESRPQGTQDDIGSVEVRLNGFVVDARGQQSDGNADEFLVINDAGGLAGNVEVYVNGQLTFRLPQATTGLIEIRGSADDDTLTVDNSNGLIGAQIIFNGDGLVSNPEIPGPGGFDTLRLIGSTATTTTYNPGETADAGALFQENNGVMQRVEFFGLEPIQVLAPVAGNNILNVASAPLGVGFPQALQGPNSINYTEGPNSNDAVDPVFAGALTGLITVDGFESLEFANFEVVNIDAGAGSDEINLNNPVTPNELTTINVVGGDPTAASDLVVVNGTAGADNIAVSQLANDGAQVSGIGPVINVDTAEQLIINGGGGNDNLSVTASAIDEVFFTPGVTEDSGSISVQSDNFGPFQQRIPLSFRDLGAGGDITIASDSGNRDLDFIVRGTDTGDDFRVGSTGEVQIFRLGVGFFRTLPIQTPGVAELFLEGLSGDDEFSVEGDHPFTQGVNIAGGQPDSGSDVLNFMGGGAAIAVDLQNQTITEAGFSPVVYAGIETANIDANGGAITVIGTSNDDQIAVQPDATTRNTRLQLTGSATEFAFTDTTGGGGDFVIDGAGGQDQVVVNSDDTGRGHAIDVPNSRITITGYIPIDVASVDDVLVNGLAGADTFTLTPGAAFSVSIDGGDPVGVLQSAGDTLNVVAAGANFGYIGGPEQDSGQINVAGTEPVSFDEIELLQIDSIDFLLPDVLEPNNTLATATVLGSEPEVTVSRATLHATQMPFGGAAGTTNDDWFGVAAHETGKLIVNALFNADIGNIVITMFDELGNLIANGAVIPEGQQIVVPVVTQERYFVQVSTADGVQNTYDLEVENFAAPTPARPTLSPASDSGMMSDDNVTGNNTPSFFIAADLTDFASMGIPVDAGPGSPGADVVIGFTNTADGTRTNVPANLVNVANTTFWTATPGALADGIYFVQAWTRVEDGQATPAVGRSPFGEQMLLTIDTLAPADPLVADLLTVSDSGTSNTDNVTNINQPAFTGETEPGAKVRLFADGELVGATVANTNGLWEITSEPLVDGAHNITVVVEDLAGNINFAQVNALGIVVDTLQPQRPTLDLPLINDSGMSNDDNVTNNVNDVPFTVSFDEDEATYPMQVVIKDGNNVIDTFVVAAGGFATRTLTLAEGTHLLSVETTDNAGNRSHQSEELVVEIDRTATTIPVAPDLLSISDTGVYNNDNVTSISAVALAGTVTDATPNSEAGTKVRVYSGAELVGQGIATSNGNWEITTEPLTDGLHDLTVEYEDIAGNVAARGPALQIEVDSTEPNLPYLDLLTDLGHSDVDNITSDNTPEMSMTSHDPEHGGTIFNDNFIFRIYNRYEGGAGGQGTEFLLYDSAADAAEDAVTSVAALEALFTANTLVLETLPEQFFATNGAGSLAASFNAVLNTGVLADGVHNLKLEVEDRAGNLSHDFLLQLDVDATPPATTIDIISSSDSGMYDNDNVTNIQQIAFQGRGDVMNDVTLFAQKVDAAGVAFGDLLIIGTGVVGSDFTDVEAGIPGATDIDGLGMWEITAEPLADGIYDVYALIEDWGGNNATSETIRLEVDTIEPNTAFLDLAEASDSGRHNDDDITNDNTPTVTMTSHDANVDLHQVLFQDNFKFRIYDRLESSAEVLLYDSSVDAAEDANTSLAGLEAMFTANTFITETLPLLTDGIHNLKLEVEDRAGNISHDFLLDVLIDTVAPPAPTVALDPSVTDSGIRTDLSTLSDRITNVETAGFYGTAEADSIVRLYADAPVVTDGVIDGSDTSIGLTVASPLDGDDAFPGGQYRAISTVNLNDGFPRDGHRQIGATAEDLAGNVSDAQFLDILVDTEPPRVVGVDYANGTTVFATKPDLAPSPAVDSLLITFAGGPPAAAGLSSPAVDLGMAADVRNYQIVGDHSGNALIDNAVIVSQSPTEVVVRIEFAELLADDRYTLTLDDSISDAAGNLLDGDSSAQAPGTPIILFPSGNGTPGGDFISRFTVDSRPEFGTISQGLVYVDINGNHVFDPEGQDNDATNRDFVMQFGQLVDAHFVGNFADSATGIASGFDKLGSYGQFNGTYSFLIDTNDDGVGDFASVMPAAFQVNGIPVAGDFNAGQDGDEIGLFDGQAWYLDDNGNNQIDANERITTNYNGLPIVGDFNGDGNDDLGVYVNDTNQFIFDTDRDGTADFTWDAKDDVERFGGLSGFTDRPVVGDINLDGIDDIGLWVKGRQGVLPKETGEFFFWVSDQVNANPADVFDAYSPAPLGNDTFAQFGDETALPIFGNFDPPVASAIEPTNLQTLTNAQNVYDVNNDGIVSALDALVVVNALHRGVDEVQPSQTARVFAMTGSFLDVDGSSDVSALDALLVINQLSLQSSPAASAEAEASPQGYPQLIDQAISELEADDEDWSKAELDRRIGLLA